MPAAVRSADPQVRVATIPSSPWSDFIDRFGVTAACALMAAVSVNCMISNTGIVAPDPVNAMQMLLLLIVLGCVAVLSYRSST